MRSTVQALEQYQLIRLQTTLYRLLDEFAARDRQKAREEPVVYELAREAAVLIDFAQQLSA